jgi:TRAP transporter TAXI family solute receptor
MSRILTSLLFSACALTLLAPAAKADFNDKKPITATVTGATPTGYPRVMLEGLNAIVRDAYPDSAVSLKPNSPGGGVLAIAEKEADFTGTATGTEIKLANDGAKPYAGSLKGKFQYAMQLFDNQFMHFIVTKEFADSNGIKSFDDIAAKKPKLRLAINRDDNPQTTIGGPYEMMKAHGWTYEDVQKWGGSYVLGNSATGLDAIKDGKADVFMNARTPGDSLIKDIHGTRPLLWLDADKAKAEKAAAVFSNRVDMLPKGTYPFMEKDYPTLRMSVSMLAGTHVSEETVYKYVKAVAEAEAAVRKIGGNLTAFQAKDMAVNPSNLPFHPGAARYYKEKGWLK